jgi:hypothetical protein
MVLLWPRLLSLLSLSTPFILLSWEALSLIDSLCHHCCPTIPEGVIEIAADFELTKEIADKEIERHKKYCDVEGKKYGRKNGKNVICSMV